MMPESQKKSDPQGKPDGFLKRILTANPDLVMRALSALVLGPMALAVTWLDFYWFMAMVLGGVFVVYWEWYTIVLKSAGRTKDDMPVVQLGFPLMMLICVFYYLNLVYYIGGIILAGTAVIYSAGGQDRISRWIAGGFAYVAVTLISLIALRDSEAGLWFIFYLFLVVWGTDVAAYVCGRSFGGPKLWPAISPNKTWSGALGGVLFSSFLGMGFVAFMQGDALVWAFVLAVMLSAVSQLGDLFESSFKRKFKVKDSSQLIPGHGGLLDRVDGLAAAAIFAYVLGMILSGSLFDPISGLRLFVAP